MIESINIIKYLLNIDNYIKYINYIDIDKNNKELLFLYNCLNELINTYKKTLSLEEYALYVLAHCPAKDREVYESILRGLESATIDDQVVGDVLVAIRNKKLAYDLALASLEVSEGRSSIESVFSVIERFEQKKKSDTLKVVDKTLEELYNDTVKAQGLRWRLATLNKMLGSLRRGNLGIVFARPESGKTTFLASEVTYFAGQVTGPVLWFNNEEDGAKVKLRVIQGMLGCTKEQLYSDLQGNYDKYLELGGKNIKIFDDASIHRRQVEQLCKELNPSLLIFDQMDKIKGFVDDREDLRLGAIYIWARELAKMYCPTIAVCQADASGEGKRWLTMDNMANAKTAKQAEGDWILGIGKTHDTALEYVRHLHLSKNKLDGDEDSDESLRHGRVDVLIDPLTARYKDIEF